MRNVDPLPTSQDKTHRQPQSIRHCVNFAAKTTTRAPQCLCIFIAFCSPCCTSVGAYDCAFNANIFQVSLACAAL
jgi:hypothetical protein